MMGGGQEAKGSQASKASLFNYKVKTEKYLSTKITGIIRYYFKV